MARTVEQIFNEMLVVLSDTPTGVVLVSNNSNVSVWRTMLYVVAYGIHVFEKILDFFKDDINQQIAKTRVHTREWYRQKALSFLFGIPVQPGTDVFSVDNLTDEEIENAKVIKQAAAVKLISSAGYGILRLKVASKQGSNLIPVPAQEFIAFKHYMNRHVVDAGTQMVITTGNGDDVRLTIDIYYDPLVISAAGTYLTNGQDVALPAIKAFLSSIEFNGRLILSNLEAYLKSLHGVDIAVVKNASSKYGQFTYDTTNVMNVGLIDEIRIADSGYFVLDIDSSLINYKVIDE